MHGIGETKAQKFASLVIGENSHQGAMCRLVSSSPLALYRLGSLQRQFKDQSSVMSKQTTLSKKIECQLHRIYRERNAIVHAGIANIESTALLEHAYSYYQSTLHLIEMVYRSVGIASSDQAIEYIGVMLKQRRRKLEESIKKSAKAASDEEINASVAVIDFLFSK